MSALKRLDEIAVPPCMLTEIAVPPLLANLCLSISISIATAKIMKK